MITNKLCKVKNNVDKKQQYAILQNMKTKTLIEELLEYKNKTGMKWRIIATELEVDKFTLSRWINKKQEPINAHKKEIKRFLKNNC